MSEQNLTTDKTPQITYFDVRGRAEVIRLILEEKGVSYSERRVAVEEWPDLKSTFRFGQLPLYEEANLRLYQSNAIYRHLARKHDLYGVSELEHCRCDMIQETLVDMQNSIGGLFWNPDFDNVRQAYEENELPTNLSRLQELLEENDNSGGFFVGTDVTYVDFIAWHYLDYVRPFALHVLEGYPLLVAFKQGIERRPNISRYLNSERRPKTLTVSMAPFGGTPETS